MVTRLCDPPDQAMAQRGMPLVDRRAGAASPRHDTEVEAMLFFLALLVLAVALGAAAGGPLLV
jgi:hypothetical protein